MMLTDTDILHILNLAKIRRINRSYYIKIRGKLIRFVDWSK